MQFAKLVCQVCDGGVQVPGAFPLGGPGQAGEGVHRACRSVEGGQVRVPSPEVQKRTYVNK